MNARVFVSAFDGRRGLWITVSIGLPDAGVTGSRFERDGTAPSARFPQSLVNLSMSIFVSFCLMVTVCNRMGGVWLLCVIMVCRFVPIFV